MTDTIRDLEAELAAANNLEDVDESGEFVPVKYDITNYGADFDVEGLVKSLHKGDIVIPRFQREFVWTMPESSRFIESLLLGLPVPGIFLAREQDTGKLLVIDGQQRLRTLQYFLDGYFPAASDSSQSKEFRLINVQPEYQNRTFNELDPRDRRNLEGSLLHAVVVKQNSPANDASIYHIFERLNSGERKLAPQEIRSAVYHGPCIDLLRELNEHPSWRKIFGKPNSRMRDQELILRFFALYNEADSYSRPMAQFLTGYLRRNRSISRETQVDLKRMFSALTDLFAESVEKPFRLPDALNVAFFDAAMVGLARRIKDNGEKPAREQIKAAYQSLCDNESFREAITRATANPTAVKDRIRIATEAFQAG